MPSSGQRGALGVLAMLAALACGPGKPDVPVDGWALARAALLDGESCYAERPEYCLDDPAFVDAAIQDVLDSRYEGQMPPNSKQVDKLIRSARVAYDEASQTPESLAKIEARVAAYYAEPTVDASDAKLVNVDLGALPGTLAVQGRVDDIVLTGSPLIEDFWWQGAEAGRVLARYAKAHPDKDIVRVQLQLPTGSSSKKTLVYRYFRKHKRVAFGELLSTSLFVTEAIEGGLETMAAGRLDLGKDARSHCSRPKSGSSSGWCPWQDPYGEAARDARREAERAARR